nr:MAG TPA: hypothetical protein [Caudoviricetes sp.]
MYSCQNHIRDSECWQYIFRDYQRKLIASYQFSLIVFQHV